MGAETIKQFLQEVSIPDLVLCVSGVLIFARWLLKTSLGRNALVDSPARRNNMSPLLLLVPLCLWFAVTWLGFRLKAILPGNPGQWQGVLLDNAILVIGVIPAMVAALLVANATFARRLRGFGLDARSIGRDFRAALVNLLAVYPLIVAAILVTMEAGKMLIGPDFQMEQHIELKQITEHPELLVRIIIILNAVFLVPVFEELLFRGLFQTMIRSALDLALEVRGVSARPGSTAWLAILLTSVVFATFHYNPQHWPALLILAISLGYAYEKSGSLFRPIFIHSLFNAVSIISALGQ